MNIGIIGCGHISDAYFTASKTFDDIDIFACADLNPEAAKSKADTHKVQAMSVDELLENDEIEITLNLTIPAAHADIALRSLENGKHTYSEKPFAIRSEDARKVMTKARENGLRVGCAPDTFLGGGQQTCRKLIDDGWIGRPVAGTAMFMGCGPERFYHPSPKFFYEPGGGPMFDLGPYYVTALVNLLGPAKRVCAITTKAFNGRTAGPQALIKRERIPVEVSTHLSGSIEFQNGAVISVITSFDVWAHTHSPIEIYGTDGTLGVPDPNTFGGPVKLAAGNRAQIEWKECPIAHQYTEQSRSVGVADMAHAIACGRAHRCSGELALHVLEIMEAFDKSSQESRHIELESTCSRPLALPLGLIEGTLDD
jgi:predicted dehydrogenase